MVQMVISPKVTGKLFHAQSLCHFSPVCLIQSLLNTASALFTLSSSLVSISPRWAQSTSPAPDWLICVHLPFRFILTGHLVLTSLLVLIFICIQLYMHANSLYVIYLSTCVTYEFCQLPGKILLRTHHSLHISFFSILRDSISK